MLRRWRTKGQITVKHDHHFLRDFSAWFYVFYYSNNKNLLELTLSFKISYKVLPFHNEHISNNACFILIPHLIWSELCIRRIMRSRHESFHSEMLYGLKDMVTIFYFESKLCCLGFEDAGYKTLNFRATTSWFLIIRNLTRNNLLSICPILYEKNSCRENFGVVCLKIKYMLFLMCSKSPQADLHKGCVVGFGWVWKLYEGFRTGSFSDFIGSGMWLLEGMMLVIAHLPTSTSAWNTTSPCRCCEHAVI